MKPDDFEYVSALLRERSGLVLSGDKAYLMESRLLPVARRWGMSSLDELAQAMRFRGDESLLRDVTEAMTTNESSFFRDIRPFEQFEKVVLPRLMGSRAATKRIKIWSAACSSGQEPYSLAIKMKEMGDAFAGWKGEIMATDLSEEILEKAKAGIYSQFEAQRGLPITLLVKYFKQDGDKWQIDESLRAMVQFKKFNLLDNIAQLGNFDVVFCRNVLIYFDQDTKRQVLDKIANQMAPDGVLYLGGAETVIGISDRFAPIPNERGLYGLAGADGKLAEAV